MILTLAGAFPRVSDEPGGLDLLRVERAWRRGQVTPEAYDKACRSAIRDAVRQQEELGLNLVCDGDLRSPDPLSPLIDGLEGVAGGSLARYFDTNTYFRRPRIVAPVCWVRPLKLGDATTAMAGTTLPVKVVLPGPYTAARLSQDACYGEVAVLARDLALALNQEARSLAASGVAELQIDEPCAGLPDADLALAAAAWRLLLEGVGCGKELHFGFSRATPQVCQAALDAGFDCLGLDFTRPDSASQLGDVRPPRLAAGVVDARVLRLEEIEVVTARMRQALELVPRDGLCFNPNLRLDFLPLSAARAKLRLMVQAAACV